jgi:hypothetical protein
LLKIRPFAKDHSSWTVPPGDIKEVWGAVGK